MIAWDDVAQWGQPGTNVTIGTCDDLGNHGRGCDEADL